MNLGAFDPRKSVWVRAVLVSLAMLFVPVVAWLLVPSPAITAPEPSAPAPKKPPKEAPTSTQPAETGRSLVGKVVDESGAPVRGAQLKFEGPNKLLGGRARSDEDGAFFLDGAPAIPGDLVITHDGFVAEKLAIAAGSDDKNGLVVTLKKAQPASGQVVDGEGRGVADASVHCEDAPTTARTDADGKFELAVGAEGCDARALHADYGSSDAVRITPGGKNVLELPTPGGIAGIVVDERGQPVPSYTIAVESFVPADKNTEGVGGNSKTISDPSGEFELTKMPGGRYVLTVGADGRPPTRSSGIDVESNRVTRGVRITLDKGLTLSGIVSDRSTKQPLSGVRINLDAVTNTNANSIRTTTADDGSFSLEGVPAGPFSVRVNHEDYRERIVSLDGRGKSSIKNDIELSKAGDGGSTEMTGIGASLGPGKDYVSVSSVLPDGPAEKAGLLPGDKIMRIDGTSAQGFMVNDCVQRLRGPEGTTVLVTAGRGDKTVDVSITRALIVR